MHAGELLNRLEGDAGVLSEIIVRRTMSILIDLGRLIGIGILLFKLNPILALLLFITFPLSLLVFNSYGKKLRKINLMAMKKTDSYFTFLSEVINGIREIKSLTVEEKTREKLVFSNTERHLLNIKASRTDALAVFINMLVGGAGLFGVILLGAKMIGRNFITIGGFVSFYSYASQFYGAMRNVTELNSTIQSSLVAMERIVNMLDMFGFTVDYIADHPYMLMPKGPVKIHFEKVSFSYDGEHEVLDSISFVAEPRSITAIVGRNGSGKTTILNLLLRFYQAKKGTIRYGGIDLQSLETQQLRNCFAILHQQPFMFQGTIRENLLLACETADDQTIVEAAVQAEIHEFIQSLPKRYDTVICGEELKLSPGLQRRLAIARALIRKSPILLFDELTDSLDGEAEASMIILLKKLSQDHTIVVVTHSQFIVGVADKVILLDNGKKTAEGNHFDLLNSCPQYRTLFGEKQIAQ